MDGRISIFDSGLDSFPLVISTKKSEEVIEFVRQVAPTFCAVNLEDIKAPNCFEIEESLQDLGIPVFHDDQHALIAIEHRAGDAGQLQRQQHVLERRHPFEQVEELKHEADIARSPSGQLRFGHPRDQLSADPDFTLAGSVEPGDQVQLYEPPG